MNAFAHTLKHWRAQRRYSQLDLASEAGISARHLSFLETGRACPSRDMVVRLGQTLEMPLEARNQMLTHAGFAARYQARGWDDAEMEPIRRAVDQLLRCHMPYPGLAVDRLWTITMANDAALALFAPFGVGIGESLLDLMISDILPQAIENWPEVAHHAALRLRTESIAAGGIAELDRAVAHLEKSAAPSPPARSPVIPTIINAGGTRLSFFSTIAQFGTSEDVTLDALKIELYFPMDAATRAAFGGQAKARE